jgi:hemolysin activation/secretion protein
MNLFPRFYTGLLLGCLLAPVFSGLATETNVPPSKPATIWVQSYKIEGNTVLPPEQFSLLTNYTGTNISFARLREGLGKLQLRYYELGFPTVGVTLPPQKPTNGVIVVKVVEGRLDRVTVTGNHHFSDENIRRALPGVTTNILLNTRWFQRELDQANANRDRQIYPVIGPGFEPGTTELTLKVKDRFPLHGRVEVNDRSPKDTALLRSDVAVQYGNLWQREHQIGFDYNFSPGAYKSDADTVFFADRPQVASYSAFYRLPLGRSEGFREESERLPVTFGYDEVSHKFNLPPPTGVPELAVFASRSASDTRVQYGAQKTIFTNTLADISSQFAQHSPSVNNDLGAKLTVPLAEFFNIRSSFQIGADFKSYSSQTHSTNLTYFDLYALDSFGNRVLVTNMTVPLAANSSVSLYYVPISLGWTASRPDPYGSFYFSWSENIYLKNLAGAKHDFETVAGSTNAGGTYTTANFLLSRQQNLFGHWRAGITAAGQWASAPLIGNEQFSLGGSSSVRGYQEGWAYGDCGWRTSLEIYAPPVTVGRFPTAEGDVPARLRTSWFMDYGTLYHADSSLSGASELSEWGTGLAFLLAAGEHFDARLTLAWALQPARLIDAEGFAGPAQTGSAQAYFSLGFQF